MHRVLASCDVCIAGEVHLDIPITPLSAVGGSVSTLEWLPPWSKKAPTVLMGSIPVNPLGIGHDTGITRPHVLVTVAPPNPWTSVAASAKATLTSSCKPMFAVHRTQAGCGSPSASLPVTAEPIPYGIGFVIATVCGTPVNLPAPLAIPLIPTQLTVWTGMTWGDIVGGIVNVVADMIVSGILGVAGTALGKLARNPIGEQAASVLFSVMGTVGTLTRVNLTTGVDNPGSIVQQWMDQDGVGSDANPAIRVLGFGFKGTADGGGPVSGIDIAGPWN